MQAFREAAASTLRRREQPSRSLTEQADTGLTRCAGPGGSRLSMAGAPSRFAIAPGHCEPRDTARMGDEGLERTADFPADSHDVPQQCAHLCAVMEIPAFVRESGRSAACYELPEDFQQRIASLPPEVLAALSALFGGQQPQR